MIIDNKYAFEDAVYLKTDPDQRVRIVGAIKVLPGGAITYELCHATSSSWHWEFEISETKDYSLPG